MPLMNLCCVEGLLIGFTFGGIPDLVVQGIKIRRVRRPHGVNMIVKILRPVLLGHVARCSALLKQVQSSLVQTFNLELDPQVQHLDVDSSNDCIDLLVPYIAFHVASGFNSSVLHQGGKFSFLLILYYEGQQSQHCFSEGNDQEDTCQSVGQYLIAICWLASLTNLGVARHLDSFNSCSSLSVFAPFGSCIKP